MAKSNRPKKLPKQVEKLTADEVMQHVFGEDAQEALKQAANPEPQPPVPPTSTA